MPMWKNPLKAVVTKMGNSSSNASAASSEATRAEPSTRRSSRNSTTSLAVTQQTVEMLREECIELGIDYPPTATKEELLELIATTRNRKRPSLWKMASDSYEELVKAIIRPPRAQYSLENLGRRVFHVDGVSHERFDLVLVNDRGLKLQCSWWRARSPPAGNASVTPCCVYLHGNSSCRCEALEAMPSILGSGISLFAFDFSGSGMSDGEYVSLGYYEREDLQTVVKYLRESGRVSTISLWGRSMGAVTALMFVERDPSISCMICDSPFSSLKTLARELVESAQLNVPRFAVGLGLRMVRSSVKSRANFDINALEPIANVGKCFVAALFAAADDDFFIRPKHAEELHNAYAGDKKLLRFPGDHNSRRPPFFLDSALIFMHNSMIHEGTLALHASDHQINVGASEFHMPAPLAHSPHSNMINGSGVAFSSTLQDEQYRALMMIDQDEHPTEHMTLQQEVDEEEAFQQMLRHALELSLKENEKTNPQ